MRANKRFIFSIAIIGIWTILTYFIVIRNHSDFQNGKSKFREKINNLENEIEQEAQNREQIVKQYGKLIQMLEKKATTTAAAAVPENNNVAVLEEGESDNPSQLNNKIEFSGKYVNNDVNVPVIPVIVFACNRVSISRSLDALIKHRPSREQFPIIVSQVSLRND